MLSVNRIQRSLAVGAHERLLEEILANGRRVALPLRMRLAEPASLRTVVLGLSLQRVVELTFGEEPLATILVRDLLASQNWDGSFGSVAATAVALRALTMARRHVAEDEALAQRVEEAIEHGVRALAARQDEADGLAERGAEAPVSARRDSAATAAGLGLIGDEIDSSVCVWQLAPCEALREALGLDELMEAVGSSDWSASPARSQRHYESEAA